MRREERWQTMTKALGKKPPEGDAITEMCHYKKALLEAARIVRELCPCGERPHVSGCLGVPFILTKLADDLEISAGEEK